MAVDNSVLVSIIVPVFNAAKTLNQCVDSILAQDYVNIEVILVDDGSNDNSYSICQEYSDKDNRVVVIHQENGGPSKARNKGIETARGELLTFVDSDDWVERDYISSYDIKSVSLGYDICFTGITRDCPKGESFPMECPLATALKKEELADFIFKIHKASMIGWVCNKIYKTSIIKKHHIQFDTGIRLREDQLFTLEYLSHSNSATSVSAMKYHYVETANSLITAKRNYIEYQKVSRRILDGFLFFDGTKEYKEYVHRSYFRDYMVGIGAIRNCNKEYTKESKVEFVRECKAYVRNCNGIDLIYASNPFANLVKKMMYRYLPTSIIYKIVFK